jgi:hypothetical protein
VDESKKRVTREKKGGVEGSWEGTVRVKSYEWRRSEERAKRQETKSKEERWEESNVRGRQCEKTVRSE